MNRISILITGLLLSIFIPVQTLHAEIYKWIDKNGNVHFGDKPDEDADNVESVEIRQSTPRSDPVLERRLDEQNKVLKVLEEDREEREADREKADKEREVRKKKCDWARDYKRRLDSAGPIYKLDKEGNRVYFNEEENKAERRKVEDLLRKWCG